MTFREASVIIGNIVIVPDKCYSIAEYQQAKTMAIEALKLQTPKKPKYIEDDYVSKAYHFECPFCGEDVDRGDNHCDNCLQILDWSLEHDR